MRFPRNSILSLLLAFVPGSMPCFATNLVTGNGFGFAVVSPETAQITKFYAHPYSFMRPNPAKPLSEGIATANFIENLSWDESASKATVEYQNDSHVIRVASNAGEGFVFMPFGLRESALIVVWSPRSGQQARGPRVKWSQPVKSDIVTSFDGLGIHTLRFDGIEEQLVLIPLGSERLNGDKDQVLETNPAWALVTVERDTDLGQAVRECIKWRGALNPRELVQREINELDQWRVKPPVTFRNDQERHLWRQSEVMLRIAQSREPNRDGRYSNGLIVASLPDGVWFTPWVRDMAWATVALAKMGHQNEARAALLAYFNARPTGKMRAETAGADYQISVVRYFGDGAEEPFFTEEGSTNIEFDDWGEALWVLGEYLKKYDDPDLLRTSTFRDTVYESAIDFIAKPLIANLEKYGHGEIVTADTSIWEERQKDKKHFAFSTAAAIVGLRNFSEVAKRTGDDTARREAMEHVAQLEAGFKAAFIRGGTLHGTLEEGVKNDIDGALLAIIHLGVVTDPAVVQTTLNRMKLLKVSSGGYRRVRSTYTDPAIFEYWYEREEFLFVDFSLAEVYRLSGRSAEAQAIITRIVSKAAADHNIIPEMYVALPCKLFPGKIGDPTGARPMVGYGAGTYILDLVDREEGERPNKLRRPPSYGDQ
jgi:GH15 family glucan-1,4-alpha-glucosidase